MTSVDPDLSALPRMVQSFLLQQTAAVTVNFCVIQKISPLIYKTFFFGKITQNRLVSHISIGLIYQIVILVVAGSSPVVRPI
jgi:hypothetical protein